MIAFNIRIFNVIIMIQAQPQAIPDKFKTPRIHPNAM
jgi:hypothetical protein